VPVLIALIAATFIIRGMRMSKGIACSALRKSILAGSLFAAGASSVATAQQRAIPDFSGAWGRNVFNFEPAESGPQPLRNLRRAGRDAGRPIVVGDPVPLVGDYQNPILRPEAAAVVKQRGEISASGHDFQDPSNQCSTFSPPYLFTIQLGMQLLQSKDQVVILYNQDDQTRHVRLNASHSRDLKPTPMGDSVGHYEGDTLVVDTVGVRVRPWTMVDRFGTPQSEAMRVVERYRLIDAREAADAHARQQKSEGCVCGALSDGDVGKGAALIDTTYPRGLRVEVRIEDPKVFTTPWTANITYMRVKRAWAEVVCAENNTDVLHQGFERVPTAARADF
jgi:hypothetical protein